ncbi:MAG TPA: hypothetical protein VFK43_14205, partial [Acidimicrobiales bacterium]|nr:hypothetical protein [Acidimicrobiales bacterium]
AQTVTLSGAIAARPTATVGVSGTSDAPGASTEWQFQGAPPSPVQLRDGDRTSTVTAAAADLRLVRGATGEPHLITGQLGVEAGGQALTGTVTGEAVHEGVLWHLAGRFQTATATGGFRATVDTRGTSDNADDLVSWRFDAVRP